MAIEKIIAHGVGWSNSPLNYDFKNDSGGVENITFEIGDSGHPEATVLPKGSAALAFFRENPEFAVIGEGDEIPVMRPFDDTHSNDKYLASLTPHAIKFLEICLSENSVGIHRDATEKRLSYLKIQRAEAVAEKEALQEKVKQAEEGKGKKTPKS